MSKPVHVVTDYQTYRGEMRETIDKAVPKPSPVLGVLVGFASTIAIIGSLAWLAVIRLW